MFKYFVGARDVLYYLYKSITPDLDTFFYEWKKYTDYGFILEQMGGDDRNGREEYRKFVSSGIDGELENPLELCKEEATVSGLEN